ncbi:regulator of replication initiation timing [Paenibacillus mucilaginosus]|uniref:methyltransferase domain-containing protein n=1 Tax=Paenibacillus mucilaginosus TaxID=61624 RepID=UPI003D1B4145
MSQNTSSNKESSPRVDWKGTVYRYCGTGPVLVLNCGEGSGVRELLKRGYQAYGIDPSSEKIEYCRSLNEERFQIGTVFDVPYADDFFELVIFSGFLPEDEQLAAFFSELQRVSSKNVYLRISGNIDHMTVEKMAFAHGFKRHPLYLLEFGRDLVHKTVNDAVLVFEKVASDEGSVSFHYDELIQLSHEAVERLHQYTSSLKYIKPNDYILDLSYSQGAGAAVLWEGTSCSNIVGVSSDCGRVRYAKQTYEAGREGVEFKHIEDAAGISSIINDLSQHEFDVVLLLGYEEVDETWWDTFKLIKHVIRPGGRVLCTIPQTIGVEAILSYLTPDYMIEHWNKSNHTEAAYYFIVGMVSPLTEDVPYEERVLWTQHRYPHDFHHSFQSAYKYPWIQHALVTMGVRTEAKELREELLKSIINDEDTQGTDYGAALCVQGYQVIMAENPDPSELNLLIKRLSQYTMDVPLNNKMKVRWHISCLFLLGQCYLLKGNFNMAFQTLMRCLKHDFLSYSPHLGTKIVQSSIQLGILSLYNDMNKARSLWLEALEKVQKAFSIPWEEWYGHREEPLTFGLREASHLLELGSQAAYALWLTADPNRIRSNLIQQIYEFSSSYQTTKIVLNNRQLHNQTAELKDWIQELSDSKSWIEDQWKQAIGQNNELEIQLSELKEWVQELELGKNWVESKLEETKVIVMQKDEIIKELKTYIEELNVGRAWNENKIKELEQRLLDIENENKPS